MGGGGDFKIEFPDYKKYKVENCHQLKLVQDLLEKENLKDPWLRNHVWRYENEMTNNGKIPFIKRMWLPGTARGVTLGFMAVGLYIVADKVFGLNDGHGH